MAEFPLIFGHPRSGTNFVCATMKMAFLPDKDYTEYHGSTIKSGHWANRHKIPPTPAFRLRGGHHFYRGACGIYVYRDGRDVAASLWNTKELQHPDWAELSFSEFLQKPLDWKGSPGRKADTDMNIVQHWLAHVKSWKNKKDVFVLAYEEMLDKPRECLFSIAKFFELDEPDNLLEFELPTEPCAPFAEVGGYGKWRDVFSADDLEYFYSIVPVDYWALYEKGEKSDDGEREQDATTTLHGGGEDS